MTSFLMRYIDMAIQLQVLTIYVHESIVYSTVQLGKSTHLQVVPHSYAVEARRG